MLVGGTSVRAFGVRGGIPMDAAQARLHKAPAWDADLTRSTRIRTTHSLTIARSAGRRGLLQRCESALNAQR